MANTNLIDSYQVDGSSNPVRLKVIVGNGQTGCIGVSIDGNDVIKPGADANNNYTDSFDFEIGSNQDLNSSLLTIPVVVTRVQTDTQTTTVIVELTGGPTPSNYPLLTENATNVGDIINYLCTIDFGN